MSSKYRYSSRFRGFMPVVIDIETGGFNSETDALLEIAAVTLKLDPNTGFFHPDETCHYHVQPFKGANIEKSALEFTGIDPYHPFRDAVSEAEALNGIFRPVRRALKENQCNRAIVVAHNAFFDNDFMRAAINRNQIKRNPFHPFSCFDTATLAGLALGQTVLAKACETAGIDFNQREAHSALYDAERTAELFCHIVNKWQSLGGMEGLWNKETSDEDPIE